MKTPLQPRDLKLDDAHRQVVIAWNDGHAGQIDYAVLRGWCPCAECQGHGVTVTFQDVPGVRVHKVEPVGLYAAQFYFSDMHNTGIYRFEYLRELCACPACSAARDNKPPRPANAQ